MNYNLPTLDHAQVKRYNKALAAGIACMIEFNDEYGFDSPKDRVRLVVFGTLLAKESGFKIADLMKFYAHAKLFCSKEDKMLEHPYSFTENEHATFNASHTLLDLICNRFPHESLLSSQDSKEISGAKDFALHVMEKVNG